MNAAIFGLAAILTMPFVLAQSSKDSAPGAIDRRTTPSGESLNARDYGAKCDGESNDHLAITTAIRAVVKGVVNLPRGVCRISSVLVVPDYVVLHGQGFTAEPDNAGRGATVVLKTFNGVGVTLNNASGLENLHVQGGAGVTGDNIQILGARAYLYRVTSSNAGNDGVRIGSRQAGLPPLNMNLWRIDTLISVKNRRHGLFIDHSNPQISRSFPMGVPNANAGTATHLDLRDNGGDGLKIGNAIDNVFVNVVAQTNSGAGVKLATNARGNKLIGIYTESNGQELSLESGADYNILMGNRAVTNASSWSDAGAGNYMVHYRMDLNAGSGYIAGVNGGATQSLANPSASGQVRIDGYAGRILANVFSIVGEVQGTSGGKVTISTKQDGDIPTRRLSIPATGGIQLANVTRRPDCEAETRGLMIFTAGARGMRDRFEICRKGPDDVYAFVPII